MEPLRDSTKDILIDLAGGTWGEDLDDGEYIIDECTFEKIINPTVMKLRKSAGWTDIEDAKDNFRHLTNYKAFLKYMQDHNYLTDGIYPEDYEETTTGDRVRIIFNVNEISEEQGRAIWSFIENVQDTETGCVDEVYAREKMKTSIVTSIMKSKPFKALNLKAPYTPEIQKALRKLAAKILIDEDVTFFGLIADIDDDILNKLLPNYF